MLNINFRKQCEFYGFTENPDDESILIIHSCTTNLELDLEANSKSGCIEIHTGNQPRSIMTKGASTRPKSRIPGAYNNFDPGNDDKLMISYRRERSHDYYMRGACSVAYEGEMHFFGGHSYGVDHDFTKQHFVIETQRSSQLVKMTKKEDLAIGFKNPSCSNFELSDEYTGDALANFKTNFVVLCFDGKNPDRYCHAFDSRIVFMSAANFAHFGAGLVEFRHTLYHIYYIFYDKLHLEIDRQAGFETHFSKI